MKKVVFFIIFLLTICTSAPILNAEGEQLTITSRVLCQNLHSSDLLYSALKKSPQDYANLVVKKDFKCRDSVADTGSNYQFMVVLKKSKKFVKRYELLKYNTDINVYEVVTVTDSVLYVWVFVPRKGKTI